MVDLGVRLGNRSALIECNGWWLLLDLAERHAIGVRFGRVRENVLEPVE